MGSHLTTPDSGLEEEVDNESDELGSSCNFLFSLAGPFLLGCLGCSSSEDSLLSLEPLGSDKSFQGPLFVRKFDLSHLCFSLNFYFLMFLSQFPSMLPLLTYSQSFFSLSADYLRHSR